MSFISRHFLLFKLPKSTRIATINIPAIYVYLSLANKQGDSVEHHFHRWSSTLLRMAHTLSRPTDWGLIG
jgi:hypothetical protein